MTDTFKRLYQGQLPATATTLYTAPATAGNATIIKSIRICNVTAASQSFTLYQGGTAAANIIMATTVLQPNETFVDTGPITLGASDTIAGISSAATSLTCTISGLEIT